MNKWRNTRADRTYSQIVPGICFISLFAIVLAAVIRGCGL